MFTFSKFNSKKSTVLFFLSAVILFIVLFFLKSVVLEILRVPLAVQSNLTREFKGLFTYKFVLNENAILKNQIDILRRDIIMLGELKLENERLKNLLALQENSKFITVAAKVIAWDPNSWSSGVVLDRGKKQGIGRGNIVISELGLIGRVLEVTGNTAKVMLINDPDSAFGAFVQRTRDDGLVSGSFYGGLILRYLDKDSQVGLGDLVLTSGIASNCPAGLLIGKIKSIEGDSGNLSKYCVLQSAIDLKKINEVLVIIRK